MVKDRSSKLEESHHELLAKANTAWAINVLKRVKGGARVSSRDLEKATQILGASTEDGSEDGDVEPIASGVDILPRFARNQVELASLLKIERKTIQRWRKEPLFPRPQSDGKWDVHAVVDWAKARGKRFKAGNGHQEEKYDLEVRRLKVVCERLELGLRIERGDYIAKEDVYKQVSQMLGVVKSKLLQIPSSLAPQLIAIDQPREMQGRLKESVDEAMRSLHEDPWVMQAVGEGEIDTEEMENEESFDANGSDD
jgi:phage terminase Nu1 subunit (DNA packaging protein)